MPQSRGIVMPSDFTGLSYEAGQLYNAEYFSSRNTALIAAFRGLSEHGVLRLGGHLSNITPWEGVGWTSLARFAESATASRITGSGRSSILRSSATSAA